MVRRAPRGVVSGGGLEGRLDIDTEESGEEGVGAMVKSVGSIFGRTCSKAEGRWRATARLIAAVWKSDAFRSSCRGLGLSPSMLDVVARSVGEVGICVCVWDSSRRTRFEGGEGVGLVAACVRYIQWLFKMEDLPCLGRLLEHSAYEGGA